MVLSWAVVYRENAWRLPKWVNDLATELSWAAEPAEEAVLTPPDDGVKEEDLTPAQAAFLTPFHEYGEPLTHPGEAEAEEEDSVLVVFFRAGFSHHARRAGAFAEAQRAG